MASKQRQMGSQFHTRDYRLPSSATSAKIWRDPTTDEAVRSRLSRPDELIVRMKLFHVVGCGDVPWAANASVDVTTDKGRQRYPVASGRRPRGSNSMVDAFRDAGSNDDQL